MYFTENDVSEESGEIWWAPSISYYNNDKVSIFDSFKDCLSVLNLFQ